MGVDAVDVDDDGDLDLLVVNLDGEADSFFRNRGTFFSDDTAAVGLRTASRPFTRFGTAFVDFDNDGYLDLFEANGRVGMQSERYSSDPYAEPSLLFRGLAGPRFAGGDPARRHGAPLIATSRAAAFGDIDNDGGVDVVVVNRDGPPFLLHNIVKPRGHWIMLRVRRRSRPRRARRAGDDEDWPAGPSVATCARHTATSPATIRGFTSGWAQDTAAHDVTVRWPDGARETSTTCPPTGSPFCAAGRTPICAVDRGRASGFGTGIRDLGIADAHCSAGSRWTVEPQPRTTPAAA